MKQYTTKDSGKRQEFSTGMVRDTQDSKPRFDLIYPKLLPFKEMLITRWADLLARGAIKYADRNWEKAQTSEELDRALASAARHFNQWIAGETDEDHAAAVMFNLQLAEYVKYRIEANIKLPDKILHSFKELKK